MLWRKKMGSSSQQWVRNILTTEEERPTVKCLLLCFLFVWSLINNELKAEDSLIREKFHFIIPQQRADLSLIEIAEQANVTLIFPFDEIKDFTLNSLEGTYSLEEALALLLKDTGLRVSKGDNGLLSIVSDESFGGINIMHRMNKLSAAILAMAATAAPISQSQAQQSNAVEDDGARIEEVVVLGIRGSLKRAADIKRISGGVVDSISSEDIGKFPDTNLAESLQRITGVSIDRSGGEGQFVTVRGFGPEFNNVLLNGRQMSTDNTGREFSFDLLASELVSGVNVNKTSTASLQSGGFTTKTVQILHPNTRH